MKIFNRKMLGVVVMVLALAVVLAACDAGSDIIGDDDTGNGNFSLIVRVEEVEDIEHAAAFRVKANDEIFTFNENLYNSADKTLENTIILSGNTSLELTIDEDKIDGYYNVEQSLIDVSRVDEVVSFKVVYPEWLKLLPTNSQNPLDRLGEYHNRLLDKFEEDRLPLSEEHDINAIVNYLVPEAIALGAIGSEYGADYETEAYVMGAVTALINQKLDCQTSGSWEDLLDKIKDILKDIESEVENSISNGSLKVPDEQKALNLLNQIDFRLENRRDSNSWETWLAISGKILEINDDNIKNTVQDLKNVDSQIHESDFLQSELEALYIASSMARHSAAFWGDVINDSDSNWQLAANGRWKRIVGKDVVGGLTGFLGGGWVGGLIGAAASSIDEWLDE